MWPTDLSRHHAGRHWPLLVLLLGVLVAGAADALVIYRFGGSAEAPADAQLAGVSFVHIPWSDLESAGGAQGTDLDLRADRIGSLRRDPTVNIAPTVNQFGGEYVRPPIVDQVWDADPTTVWDTTPYLCAKFAASYLTCTDDFGTLGTANILLGSHYQIDRIRLLSGISNPERTVSAVRVFLGRTIPDGDGLSIPPPFSPWAVEVRDNRQQVLDIPMPPNDDVGFVQVAIKEHTNSWAIHDIEIYARGFAKRSVYTTGVLDMGRPMAWGEMHWQGTRGDRAKVVIQTRSGHDSDPVKFWTFTGRGEERTEVTRAAYGGLAPGEKAGTSYDHGNWSFWSTYEFGDSLGVQMASPSSRRYLQMQVEFSAQDDDGGQLQALEFRASEPLVTALVGEIWPVQAAVGERTRFTYAVAPTIAAHDAGFDRLTIESPALLGAVTGVRIDGADADYEVQVQQAHRIVVAIPALGPADSGALVAVDFDARVLRYGDRFDGTVRNSARPLEVPQGINAGDASSEFDGDVLAVATAPGKGPQLLRAQIRPQVVTPNGDGINDELQVTYELYEVTGVAQVRVEVFDLSGRRLALLHEGGKNVGSYEARWDGTSGGKAALPGVYIVRVQISTDGKVAERTNIIHVVW